MAISAAKTWVAGEILTASDLNSEFLNVYGGGQTLGWPATESKDFAGNVLILDADGDTTLRADVDDIIKLKLSGTDLFQFNGSVATPVNAFDFHASATGTDPSIRVIGNTDRSLNIIPRGTGVLKVDGDEVATILAAQVYS